MLPYRAALLAACLLPASDDLAFAPREGTRAVQTYAEATEWELTSIQQFIDGVEFPVEELSGMRVETVRAVALVDEYVALEGTRPTQLTRTVERADASSDLALATPMGPLELTLDAESDLVDEELRFEWDPERETYGIELESGALPATLDALRVEAGLQQLLGTGSHAPGERWTVDAERFVAALCAGGDLGLVPSRVPELPGDGISGIDLVAATRLHLLRPWDVARGKVDFVREDAPQDGDADSTRIALEGELELEVDLTDELERIAGTAGLDATGREDYRARVVWTLEVDGELVWNLAADRFEGLVLEGEGEATLALDWIDPLGTVEIEARVTTATELEFGATEGE